MKYKALTAFTGVLAMEEGEIKEISDKAIVQSLLKAKYIEEYNEQKKKTKRKERKK